MAKSYALYLTDHYAALSEVDASGMQTILSLSFSEDSYQEKLTVFLEQHSLGIISVFIDVMGEEVKHERIPHISGKDREHLLKRKFKTLFPGADLTWKQHLKRETTGRKDDIYILLGISLPIPVKQVMAVLAESQHNIRGVYFIPVLQQQLGEVLPENQPYLIISSIPGGQRNKKTYRQTFYKNKALTVSRVNNAAGTTDQELFDQLFKEIERTYQFLEGSRQLDQHQALSVIVMLSDHDSARLIDHNAHVNVDLKYANLNQLAQQVGLSHTFAYKSLPELLCMLASSKKLKPHFQPADICNQHKVDIIKKWLVLSSAAAVVLSVFITGYLWLSAHEENEKHQLIASKITKVEQQKASLSAQQPTTEIPPKIMHQTVQLYRDIARNGQKPDKILAVIARAYQGYQDIALNQITWINRTDKSNVDEEESFELDEFEEIGDGSFSAAIKAPAQFKIVLQPDINMSNREMLARVDAFSASLLEQPEIQTVTRDKSAIDTRSSAQLEESIGRHKSEKRPDFTLLITM